MLRRKMLKVLAVIPFVGVKSKAAKPKQSVVVRAQCGCEGYVKSSIPYDNNGWFHIPQKTCMKCYGMIYYYILEEDNPNLNQIQRSKK